MCALIFLYNKRTNSLRVFTNPKSIALIFHYFTASFPALLCRLWPDCLNQGPRPAPSNGKNIWSERLQTPWSSDHIFFPFDAIHWRSVSRVLLHIHKPEGEQKIQKFIRVGIIGLYDILDLFQPVKERAPVNIKILRRLCDILMVFQIASKRLVELGMVFLGFIF